MKKRPASTSCLIGSVALLVILVTVATQLLFVYAVLVVLPKYQIVDLLQPESDDALSKILGPIIGRVSQSTKHSTNDSDNSDQEGNRVTFQRPGCPSTAPTPAAVRVPVPVPVLLPAACTQATVPIENLWKPLETVCNIGNGSVTISDDPFPPSFDAAVYEKFSRPHWMALASPANAAAASAAPMDLAHYNLHGRSRGWTVSRGQYLRNILNNEIVPGLPGNKLEIGPFLKPLLFGSPTIKYFDILDLPGLQARAKQMGVASVRPVPIDYVHPAGDLTSIPDKGNFSMVFSAHAVEHQLDLVRHLNGVSNLLAPGGYYVMLAPDKRYCFDHFLPESTIADVLDDYFNNRQKHGQHKLKSILANKVLASHNHPDLHWVRNHQAPMSYSVNAELVQMIQAVMHLYKVRTPPPPQPSEYIDSHNYQLTPQGFVQIIDTLHALGLTPLRVHRLYETRVNDLEFAVVLKKCGAGTNAQVD